MVPGETALAFYKAKNPTDKPIIGISTYNVVPFEAGQYFNKIQVSVNKAKIAFSFTRTKTHKLHFNPGHHSLYANILRIFFFLIIKYINSFLAVLPSYQAAHAIRVAPKSVLFSTTLRAGGMM